MRRGVTNKEVITSVITSMADGQKSGGQVIGINLGRNFCAEHERGIEHIKSAFGIPKRVHRCTILKDIVGAKARTATRVPSGLKFFEDLYGYAYLIYTDTLSDADQSARNFNLHLEGSNEDLETAWAEYDDGGQFGIRMKNDVLNSGAIVLGQIYEAIENHDAMIFLSGSENPFARASLVIAIRSRVPEEHLLKMKEADEDYLNLEEAVERTGIEEKLKEAKKGYYALRPMWASRIKSTKDGEIKTQHPAIFFLNPYEQKDNNSGWFTVEQLLDWIDGKGPIPKAKAA